MEKQILIVVAIFLFLSCQEHHKSLPDSNTDTVVTDSVSVLNGLKSNLNIQTNSFVEIDSSGIIMFPLSMAEQERENERSYFKEVPGNSYWNLIFYNSNKGDSYLLSERKMIIKNFDFKNNSEDNAGIELSKKYIFYQVVIDDYNKDRKLTLEDPEYLFVSDKEGRNFRQISPPNLHLKSWQFIKSINKVLMIVTKDNNNDKKFEEKDEVLTYQIDIDKETIPREIFSLQLKNKLKLLYNKDWKRIKK